MYAIRSYYVKLLNSDTLLDILVRHGKLTAEQRQFITLEKGKQRQKILRQAQRDRVADKVDPDLVDIRITSYNVCYTKLLRVRLGGTSGRK